MLLDKEFASLVLKREEFRIVDYFEVDSALHQYLEGLKKGRLSNLRIEEKKDCEKYILEKIRKESSTLAELDRQCEDTQEKLESCLNLLRFTNDFLGRKSPIVNNNEVLRLLDIVRETVTWINMLKMIDQKNVGDAIRNLIDLITKGIHKKPVDKDEVEYWNEILSIEWGVNWVADTWKNRLIHQVSASIDNHFLEKTTAHGKIDVERYLDFYANDLESLSLQEDLERVIDQKAYKSAEDLLNDVATQKNVIGKLIGWFKAKVGFDVSSPKVAKLFGKIFLKEYDKVKEVKKSELSSSITFLMNWSFSNKFYEVFASNSFESFKPSTRNIIEKVSKDFNEVVKSLHSKTIIVEHLEIILRDKDKFYLLVSVLCPQKVSSSSVDKSLTEKISVEICEYYLEVFKLTKSHVLDFITICKLIQFDGWMLLPRLDVMQFQDKMERKHQMTKITDLVEIHEKGKASSFEYFGLTQETHEELIQLVFLKDSWIFRGLFRQFVDETPTRDEINSWENILDLWKTTKKRLLNIVERIDDGNVTLEEVTTHFFELGEDEKLIDQEVDLLYKFYLKAVQTEDDDSSAIDHTENSLKGHKLSTHLKLRQKQIYNVFQSQKFNDAINILLDLKEILDFQGNFVELLERKEMMENQSEKLLKSIPELLNHSKICDIDEHKQILLKMFVENMEFVQWIQEYMKDIKELNTFCELGMISAGDNTIDLDRISFMLGVVNVYAPLIFWKHYNPTALGNEEDSESENCKEPTKEDMGFNDLLDRCDQVWKHSQSIDNLSEKWEDTCKQLPWFKDLGQLHGSIEKLSLTRAQEINTSGIYTIECNEEAMLPNLENCLKLSLRHSSRNSVQVMNLEELRDLQSKLMLIAGEAEQGRHEVNMFVEVLASVEKLTQVYVNLLASGCMLFSNWSANIICCESKANKNLLLQIKFANNISPVCENMDCLDLNKLTKIMSETLEKWNQYVTEKRMEYYYLNEFNIQQILYLSQQLCLFKKENVLSEQVRMLLTYVQKEFTPEQLEKSLEEATEIYQNLKRNSASLGSNNQTSSEKSVENKDLSVNKPGEAVQELTFEKELDIIKTLTSQYVVGEEVAKAALQSEGCDNIDDLEHWILVNSSEKDLISELCKQFDEAVAKSIYSSEEDAGNQEYIHSEQYELKHKLNLVHKLAVQHGENAAKAAVQAEGCVDIDDLNYWILEHESDQNTILELSKAFGESIELLQIDEKDIQIIPLGLTPNQNTLLDVIRRLQEINQVDEKNSVLKIVSTICDRYLDEAIGIDLQDSISIEHLGLFLDILSKTTADKIYRELLSGLNHGQPNVLICNGDEILPTVLSLYLKSANQPLPSSSEVVICNEDTTADEVDRFMRRAMCDSSRNGQCLYTLAFADKLRLDISTSLERLFGELTSRKEKLNESYQLVILLSEQKHYLATCFDKYVVDGKWSSTTKEIQTYLKRHLKVKSISAAGIVEEKFVVKVVGSNRSGVGKSLHVKRLKQKFENNKENTKGYTTSIRLLENKLSYDYVIDELYQAYTDKYHFKNEDMMLAHIDITPAVQFGIEEFIFKFFVLRNIQGRRGNIWTVNSNHFYAIEVTDFLSQGKKKFFSRHILNLLPGVRCLSPLESYRQDPVQSDKCIGMDEIEFLSEKFQRPYQYLLKLETNEDLDSFAYSKPNMDSRLCIEVLLRHCCMKNPSWAQLHHFCSFLNVQLENCEKSIFCTNPIFKPELDGLKVFAVKFMIKMAQDFATPSLKISDTSMSDSSHEETDVFQNYQIRRKWEESAHAYLFFNDDRRTFTFINVKINDDGHLLGSNGVIVEHNIAPTGLVQGIKLQQIDLETDFDAYPREEKLRRLQRVLGLVQDDYDPDPTYELTTDNVLKILAIHMRFRCQIPVILMGETGCGKTRLVEFMSKLKAGRPEARDTQVCNMITLKIHGGITVEDIQESVRKAKELDEINEKEHDLSTVLFYDEANTTEAIYAIKEVMCDHSISGKSFKDSNLCFVAACNPYKQLSKEAIEKLENSGLGYQIHSSKTTHLFGNIPVRTLVYRVVALPPSMQPFVWDFGQLNDQAEKIYIEQMTRKLATTLNLSQRGILIINNVLSESQKYMRRQTSECRYVSLRDVERCMTTFEWFYSHSDKIYLHVGNEVWEQCERQDKEVPEIDEEIRTLIQTVGVCYHTSLEDRKSYRNLLEKLLNIKDVDANYIGIELAACQSVFLRNVRMEDNIACNEALRENVFMIAICADMKIPLFLIGKPGSSKSLAKTIVANNMDGPSSSAPIYRDLKRMQIISFQCSALTDAAGIERVFFQAAQLQKDDQFNSFTAVVVLDEIGLAEDSPNMPLKVLHPLLERRSTDLTTVSHSDQQKVGFVGISNWALDPAKMNRGIFLMRNNPTNVDLRKTGKEIVQNKRIWKQNEEMFKCLTASYLEFYRKQKREYFGLRDYYSLMKMLCAKCSTSCPDISAEKVLYVILRNFSGGNETFSQSPDLQKLLADCELTNINVKDMILDNLGETESRFLLLLVNQFSVISLLETFVETAYKDIHIVFGSSFPGDHSYTEICRNINRIKVCMETGKIVVLLNMSEIHESLYDTLNQHYSTFGGQNYVDLGLGGHKVKCRVSKKFRLIVIEKKDVVFELYPIPLINRLEKHYFDSKSLLDKSANETVEKLTEWTDRFTKIDEFNQRDAFVGFHDDTACSIVLTKDAPLKECQSILLQSCAVDAILRLSRSELCPSDIEFAQDEYFKNQQHDKLSDVLQSHIKDQQDFQFLEIVSYSGILSETDQKELVRQIGDEDMEVNITRWSLELFQTQQEYSNKLDKFFKKCSPKINKSDDNKSHILLIQCSQAHVNTSLISCAKHCLMNKIREFHMLNFEGCNKVIVALLLSTERDKRDKDGKRTETFMLQHTPESQIIYVDDLRSDRFIAPVTQFFGKSLSEVFEIVKNAFDDEIRCGLINIKTLLNESVSEAVSKVQNETGDNSRYFQRIQILKHLISGNTIAGKFFYKIFLSKIEEMFAQEDQHKEANDWIVTEAQKRENLQEGGTFNKTLWLCLKRHTSNFLAYVISVADRYNNLSIIFNKKVDWKVDVWLKMFELLEIPNLSEISVPKFTISLPKHLKSSEHCLFPFSFEIIEFFRTGFLTLKSEHSENLTEILTGLFRNERKKMHEIVCQALDISTLSVMKAFASDVVMTLFTPCLDEADLIKEVLFTMSKNRYERARYETGFTKGDEIAIVFFTYKHLEKKINAFSQILKVCPEVWANKDTLIQRQKESVEFILHVEAFKNVLDLLKNKIEIIIEPNEWVEWLNMTRRIKMIYNSATSEIDDKKQLRYVADTWLPSSLLHSFLLHILPSFSNETCGNNKKFCDYLHAIIKPAKMFCKAMVRNDARGSNFLRIVTNILKMCYKEIELRLLTKFMDPKCRICGKKVRNPTFLQCGDFGCQLCVEPLFRLVEARKNCPICHKNISDDFIPNQAILTQDQQLQLCEFRSNCTAFFIKYLEEFCFKHHSNMIPAKMEPQIKLLLKEFIAQVDDENRKELEATGLDLNVNTKSTMLEVLFNQNAALVIKEIDSWLQQLDGRSKQNLITVLLQYFEKSLNIHVTRKIMQKEGQVFTSVQHFQQSDDVLNWMELREIAEVRCCIFHLVSDYESVFEESTIEKMKTSEINLLAHITSPDVSQPMKDYFIKVGCHIFGTPWLRKIASHHRSENLISKALIQAADSSGNDYWTLLGDNYTAVKTELYELEMEHLELGIEGVLRNPNGTMLTKLLAIFTWSQQKDLRTRQHILNAFENGIGANLLTRSTDKFLYTILKKFFPNQHQNHTIYQLVILVAAAASCKNEIMEGFFTLMTNTVALELQYLPGMPEDLFFATPANYRLTDKQNSSMYRCPNGHLYSIGNCTRPTHTAQCPTCKKTIGGTNHRPVSGNEKIVLTPQSQAGYKRSSGDSRLSHAAERISPQGAAVVEFILHSSMLIGLQIDPVTISRMLGFNDDLQSFNYLRLQLDKSLQDLSKSLSKNLDDAVLILSQILLRIVRESPANHRENWTTLEERRDWEQRFRQNYILPVFQNIERELIEAQSIMTRAEDATSAPLIRLLHDVSTAEELEAPFNHDHVSLWNFIDHPNLNHLSQKLSDCLDPNLGKVVKILLRTPNLHLVKDLQHVLQLQRSMIEKYSRKIDMKDSDEVTFRDYLTEYGADDEKLIQKYILSWNKILPFLQNCTPEKMQKYSVEISEDSPISSGLPTIRGRGQFAKFIAEYLIDIQNDFLSNCGFAMDSSLMDEEVEVPDLVSADFIFIDEHRDLISLLYKHSNYDIAFDENGKHHRISYNIDALEKQIIEKFVLDKKLIKKNTLPYMKYPQDFGIGSDWKIVSANIEQESLTAKLAQDVDRQAERCLSSEICTGVRTLSTAIALLAVVKIDASQFLCEFLERDLQISSSQTFMIPKSAHIKHILSLYQRLSWHKSVQFVQQGLDPYREALSTIDQENIPLEADIAESLERTDIAKLQQKINEMLITMPEDLQGNWSLVEDVFPNIKFLDQNEDDSWYCNLPAELCCKHISDLFSYTVHYLARAS
uniref:E3 ubiquitin-protein ligase rnf213-alpha-like n=1 Tax=Styela clava TaxID=7725 RepID=UPI00193A22D9|nr:E3 ubiquitin-protein ligase rnf213-alpha-like [Styela clava]